MVRKLKGTIIKSTGSWYSVLAEDQKIYPCRLKGKMRLEGLKSTNPVAVGDRVFFHFDEKLEHALIDRVEKRKNFLVRKSAKLSKQTHIIAANIDYSLLLVSLREPRISSAFIDRFLVVSSAYEIEPVIVFTKIDIYREKELIKLAEYENLYGELGYKCIATSSKEKKGVDELILFLQNKTSLLIGQSGVGKSSLLNTVKPGLMLKTKPISRYTGKGQHATTFYEMYPVANNTYIIDSPGIRELGLVDFEPWEVSLFFPEMKALANNCKFNTCLHINEPGCAVLSALDREQIQEERYFNYLKILEGFEKGI